MVYGSQYYVHAVYLPFNLPPIYYNDITLQSIIQINVFIAMLYVLSKLLWMCIYEWKYYRNAGEEYMLYGKEFVKSKFIKISNGKIGKKDRYK